MTGKIAPVTDWMVGVVCSCLSRVALHCQGEAVAGAAADEAAAEVCQAAAAAVVA